MRFPVLAWHRLPVFPLWSVWFIGLSASAVSIVNDGSDFLFLLHSIADFRVAFSLVFKPRPRAKKKKKKKKKPFIW